MRARTALEQLEAGERALADLELPEPFQRARSWYLNWTRKNIDELRAQFVEEPVSRLSRLSKAQRAVVNSRLGQIDTLVDPQLRRAALEFFDSERYRRHREVIAERLGVEIPQTPILFERVTSAGHGQGGTFVEEYETIILNDYPFDDPYDRVLLHELLHVPFPFPPRYDSSDPYDRAVTDLLLEAAIENCARSIAPMVKEWERWHQYTPYIAVLEEQSQHLGQSSVQLGLDLLRAPDPLSALAAQLGDDEDALKRRLVDRLIQISKERDLPLLPVFEAVPQLASLEVLPAPAAVTAPPPELGLL